MKLLLLMLMSFFQGEMLRISTPLQKSIFFSLTSMTSTEKNPEILGKTGIDSFPGGGGAPFRYELSHFGKGSMCFTRQHEDRAPRGSGGSACGHVSNERVFVSPVRMTDHQSWRPSCVWPAARLVASFPPSNDSGA